MMDAWPRGAADVEDAHDSVHENEQDGKDNIEDDEADSDGTLPESTKKTGERARKQ